MKATANKEKNMTESTNMSLLIEMGFLSLQTLSDSGNNAENTSLVFLLIYLQETKQNEKPWDYILGMCVFPLQCSGFPPPVSI